MKDSMDDEERDYEVRENHGLARGIMGGLAIALTFGGGAIALDYHPMLGIGAAMCVVTAWNQYKYRG